MTRYVLVHRRAPGDIVCLTALPRDIHAAYPGRFELYVATHCSSLWENNPHVKVLDLSLKNLPPDSQVLQMEYGAGIREQKHETIHFCSYFHRDFERKTKLKVPMTLPFGDLHLSAEEQTPLVEGRYWCVISGGKSDFPVKVWDQRKFQKIVDRLRDQGIGVVQLGDNARGHWHPPMEGALNLIGRTSLRDMLRIIKHSDGLVCGVTAGSHMAAALQRPCVVVAGGREAWYWEAYVRENRGLGGTAVASKLVMPHRFLHTIGLLACCRSHGCWRNKVVKTGTDRSVCELPVLGGPLPIPECMDMITAEHVINACLSYYYDGSLAAPAGSRIEETVRGLQSREEHDRIL